MYTLYIINHLKLEFIIKIKGTINMQKYKSIELPFGNDNLALKIPLKNYIGTVKPHNIKGLENVELEVEKSLKNPIGLEKLSDIAKEKKGKVCIVVNDITRPTPSKKLLMSIVKQLNQGGIIDQDIIFLIATGTHRSNIPIQNLRKCEVRYSKAFLVINHNGSDPNQLKLIGETKRGVPVQINKWFREANIRILTGTIAPHQSAGYSGGRKSIMPGIAGEGSTSDSPFISP